MPENRRKRPRATMDNIVWSISGPDTSSTEHCIAADPSQIDQHRLWRWHFFAASSRGRRCARKSECDRA
jgi:hypothetical protein